MDKVQGQTWQTGFDNNFAWTTADVIKKLKQINNMYELGIVVRLNNEYPSKEETVAPVIFYHNLTPPKVSDYLFTFKTNGSSRLTCRIYKEGSKSPIFTQTFTRIWGGQPFTVRWNGSSVDDGWYRLVINGTFRNNNDPIDKVVRFYHKRAVN